MVQNATAPASGENVVARSGSATFIAIGAVCGTAWAAGFRAYMAELAGPGSVVDWWGTFVVILLPGAVTGGLLGWAEALRRRGGRRRWRWLALAPLVLAVAPLLLLPGGIVALLTEGLGGGAIAVALIGLGGGYAVSGRGPLWARLVCGVLSAGLVAALVATTPSVGGPRLSLTEPRGAWASVLAASFMVVLALASAIPHRPVTTALPTAGDEVAGEYREARE